MNKLILISLAFLAFTSCNSSKDNEKNAGIPAINNYAASVDAFDAAARVSGLHITKFFKAEDVRDLTAF